MGLDLLAGGAAFCWDPFETYSAGLVTNPNTWVLGEPGNGKSALVKCLLWRMAAVFGLGNDVRAGEGHRGSGRHADPARQRRPARLPGDQTDGFGHDDHSLAPGPPRQIAIVDPKGEYVQLAQRLGLDVVKLTPGGSVRVNPLASGPAAAHEPEDRRVLRQAEMLTALLATILDRPLTQLEDAAIFAALEQLALSARTSIAPPADAAGDRRSHQAHGHAGIPTEPTLADVAALLQAPSTSMLARLQSNADDLRTELLVVAYALDKLLTRSLRGMFDGPSTVVPNWDGPGILLDLSAVPLDSKALPLVMTAAAGWLQQLMARPGALRVQVLDETWALLGNRHTAGYLQSCFKLGRSQGVANICIAHRPSDLGAQADDGTATAKVAAGLLADSATKVILRQAPDQLDLVAHTLGLTPPQAEVVAHLPRGRALWRIADCAYLVQHLITAGEDTICDTDIHQKS